MRFGLGLQLVTGVLLVVEHLVEVTAAEESLNGFRLSPQKKVGLTIDEFTEVLFSEAGNEFGLHNLEEEETKNLWDSASSYEWTRAKQIEEEANLADTVNSISDATDMLKKNAPDFANAVFPFVVCDPNAGKSGYRCKQDIEGYFGDALMAVSNSGNRTCYFVSTLASIAERTPLPLMIHPVMPEMKLQQGMVDEIAQPNTPPSRLYSMFCPSHSGSPENAENIVNGIIGSFQNQRNEGGRSLVAETFLRMKEDTAVPQKESQLRQALSRESGRHLLWSSALEDGINSEHKCEELFSELNAMASLKGDSFIIDLPSKEMLSSVPNYTACLHSLIAGLSIRPEICSVGIVPDMKATNKEAQWIVQSGNKAERPFFDSGLTGEGEVVAVSDSGLDTQNCYFRDATGDTVRDGSVDPSRRKVVQYIAYADGSDEKYGHGTHVVGTLVGRKAENGKTESTGLGDGIARDAKVSFFDIGNGGEPYLSIPDSISQLLEPGRNAGAQIHSASWGSNFNGYGYGERELDGYLRENDDFMFIVAAGNSGSGRNTVGSPATSKNGISVGASQNGGDHIQSTMLGKDYLEGFSSRGPTADGRTKPDIIAPGSFVLSAAAGSPSGECESGGLHFLQGTSMATPVVSGTAALVRQYFRDGFYPSGRENSVDRFDPSGQLVKAVLLNGAQFLAGEQRRDGSRRDVMPYDVNQNFGRVSLINSLPLDGKNTIGAKVVDRKSIGVEEVDRIIVEIDTTGGCDVTELSVTLCWADLPAVPNCAQCLLNDLDLYVTKDGDSRTYFANGRNSRDSTNNAERVRVPASNGDRFTIHIEATDLEERSQDYSVVVTGCIADGESNPPTDGAPVEEPTPRPNIPTVAPAPTPSPTPAPVVVPTPKPTDGDNGSSPGGQLSIDTTFTGQYYLHGNMFDLQAKKNIMIAGMAFHTMSEDTVSVEVWTKSGSLVGSQEDPNAWTRIASASVRGRGIGEPTVIPSAAFSAPVSVRAGETQAFYVTLDVPAMLFSEGSTFGSTYAENGDLAIEEGLASAYRFGVYQYPYVWNGAIEYVTDANSIATTMEADAAYYGNMFDVEAGDSSITVTDLEIHTLATDEVYVEVWTRLGTYEGHETDMDGWTLLAFGYVPGHGEGSRTPIPQDMFDQEVTVPAGETRGFYVKLVIQELLYSFGETAYSNDDGVIVRSGVAIGLEGDTYSPRTWNGVVRYRK